MTHQGPARFDRALDLACGEGRNAVWLDRVVPALAPGGTLLVIGHDRRNLDEGVGGPRRPG